MGCCFRYTARTERFMEEELARARSSGAGAGLGWLVLGLFGLLLAGLVLGVTGR